MHNDVKQCFRGIVGVVVTNKLNMASYFPEARKLNDSNDAMCSNLAGPSGSGSGDLFELSDTTCSTVHISHFLFERDYNSHTAFRDMLRHYCKE